MVGLNISNLNSL